MAADLVRCDKDKEKRSLQLRHSSVLGQLKMAQITYKCVRFCVVKTAEHH